MDIRLRFPAKRPFLLDDCWPLEGYGAVAEFERNGQEVVAMVVTFRDQPLTRAPKVTRLKDGPAKLNIAINGEVEALGRNIVKRFSDYINLYLTVEFDLDAMESEFIPKDEQEKSHLGLYNFKASRERGPQKFDFSILAQAFFAGEGLDDPSYASHLSRAAREAFVAHQYIDAFRYAFMLIEAHYGRGEFRKAPLIAALSSSEEFMKLVADIAREFMSDPFHAKGKAKELVQSHGDGRALVKFIVERRGFYFHGNIIRKGAWHPDRQEEAQGIAEFCVTLAQRAGQLLASAMFTPEIGKRHSENAKRQGATMSIKVRYQFVDTTGAGRAGELNMNVPGNLATNSVAIGVHTHFLEWATVELNGSTLLSAVATNEDTGVELFRTQFHRATVAAVKPSVQKG